MSAAGVDVSVVLNAHREGRLAHHAIESARRAMAYAERNGVHCELVAIVDRPDVATRAHFEDDRADAVAFVDFGDLSRARNHGAKLARGTYVAFLDADDMYSEQWLASAFRCADQAANGAIVWHPQLNVFFGASHRLFRLIDQRDPAFSRFDLFESNGWTAQCFVRREQLLAVPYLPIDFARGVGFEDWHWNCEIIAAGGEHRVVPDSAYFMRVKHQGSLAAATVHSGANIGRTALFEEWDWRATHHALIDALPGGVFTRKHGTPNPADALPPPHPNDDPFPQWLVDEWRALHAIDPSTFPHRELVDGLFRYRQPRSRAAVLYRELNAIWPRQATHVLFAPWCKHGGADLAARHHVDAWIGLGVRADQIVLITTEDSQSPWLDRFPQAVTKIELGRIGRGFSDDDLVLCLLRLMVQKRPQVLHNINSRLCYELLRRHGRAVAAETRLFASAYCFDYSPEGRAVGYAADSLPGIFSLLTGVFTDSQHFIDTLVELYGFEREKLHVARLPAPRVRPRPEQEPLKDRLDVLWASRFVRQKRPDILLEVVRRCEGMAIHFHVWGNDELGGGTVTAADLLACPNVSFYGTFDDFGDLPHWSYDVLLYTSQWDGLPNILLEAMAAGLVCVAPPVGGIGELIDEKNGCLVSAHDAIDDYVRALERLARSRTSLDSLRLAALAKLRGQHSREGFEAQLLRTSGYGPGSDLRSSGY